MDSGNLCGILTVFLDNGATGEFAHSHDMIGVVHTVFLDSEHGGIHISARTVEVGSVNMDHEGFASHLLGMDTGGIISKSIVRAITPAQML